MLIFFILRYGEGTSADYGVPKVVFENIDYDFPSVLPSWRPTIKPDLLGPLFLLPQPLVL